MITLQAQVFFSLNRDQDCLQKYWANMYYSLSKAFLFIVANTAKFVFNYLIILLLSKISLTLKCSRRLQGSVQRDGLNISVISPLFLLHDSLHLNAIKISTLRGFVD